MSGREETRRPEPQKKDDVGTPIKPEPPHPEEPSEAGTWGGEGGAGDYSGGPTTSGDGGSEVM